MKDVTQVRQSMGMRSPRCVRGGRVRLGLSLGVLWALLTATVLPGQAATVPPPTKISVDGVQREALVFLPSKPGMGPDGSPVLLVFHGHGSTMQYAATKGFHELWPEAIVVYPQGLQTATPRDKAGERAGWQRNLGDSRDRDLKFVDAILAYVRSHYRVDGNRIYATGHSNGGGFIYLLFAARAKDFTALAPSAAGAPALRKSGKLQPRPIMHIAGKSDEVVSFDRQMQTMKLVRKVNGCEEKGQPWASLGKLSGTIYPSKSGTPFVAVIHPGTHQYPDEAPALIIKFFQENPRRAEKGKR